MEKILQQYLPTNAVIPCLELIKTFAIHLKIVNKRKSVAGTYCQRNGQHLITINADLNPYQFLITLIHEISHLVAHLKYGRTIKPHGWQWKFTFKCLMTPFISPDFFPLELIPLLAKHFQSPMSSEYYDSKLRLALEKYNKKTTEYNGISTSLMLF